MRRTLVAFMAEDH